ncbi:MAG: hypothetical protein WCF94_00875 [bacterium]
MSIKEFAHENSTALFYTTIALIVTVIVLGVVAFTERGSRNFFQRNFQNGNRQGMMQGKGFQRGQYAPQASTTNPVEGQPVQ